MSDIRYEPGTAQLCEDLIPAWEADHHLELTYHWGSHMAQWSGLINVTGIPDVQCPRAAQDFLLSLSRTLPTSA